MRSITNPVGHLNRRSHSSSSVNSGAIALGKNTSRGKSSLILNWAIVRGALRCAIHAGNLSEPVRAQFPVRIAVRKVRSYERARNLVEKLIGPRI